MPDFIPNVTADKMHCKSCIIPQTLLTQDDQPTPHKSLSIYGSLRPLTRTGAYTDDLPTCTDHECSCMHDMGKGLLL